MDFNAAKRRLLRSPGPVTVDFLTFYPPAGSPAGVFRVSHFIHTLLPFVWYNKRAEKPLRAGKPADYFGGVMIELKHVTRRYGAVEAVRDLSFRAPAGQIVGLLGQNGAGKTTTLNMLTGYFPPTSGQVLVDGLDMLTNARACKRNIGYLPEKPPLYDEMTVRGYLSFVCRLREVARKDIPRHMDEIIDLCGLGEVRDRRLGNLSKGFRQRVGVAQALCGNPPVLVLDEPTVGLDPRQVVEIRALMRELGKRHTVIFSSHMLPEIQQLCQRVVILHRGRLIREADMSELTDDGDVVRLRASIAMRERLLLPALKSLPCVRRVRTLPTPDAEISEVALECAPTDEAPQRQLFRLLCGLDAPLLALTQEKDTLETVFLRATAEDDQTTERR